VAASVSLIVRCHNEEAHIGRLPRGHRGSAYDTQIVVERSADTRLKRAAKRIKMLRNLRDALRVADAGFQIQLLLYIGRFPSRSVRHSVYRSLGLKLAPNACIHRGAEIREPKNISIGAGSIIGFDAILDGRRGVSIGANVNLSSEVAIWTVQHDPQDRQFGVKGGPVHIGDRAWLSFRSTILPGVTVGEGAVVAAGAIVTHDVAPYTIVGGTPASVIGNRSRDLSYELGAASKPWFI